MMYVCVQTESDTVITVIKTLWHFIGEYCSNEFDILLLYMILVKVI